MRNRESSRLLTSIVEPVSIKTLPHRVLIVSFNIDDAMLRFLKSYRIV